MSKIDSPVAAFDFDGTVTTEDTFVAFLKYWAGRRAYRRKIARLSGTFMAYGTRLISRHRVKAKVCEAFFSGVPEELYLQKAQEFARDVIPPLVRPMAIEEIERRKSEGATLIIVSASLGPYLRFWSESFGDFFSGVVATELEAADGILTGKLKDTNCWGPNKPAMLEAAYPGALENLMDAYGDSRGDRELLASAKRAHFKPFRLTAEKA